MCFMTLGVTQGSGLSKPWVELGPANNNHGSGTFAQIASAICLG